MLRTATTCTPLAAPRLLRGAGGRGRSMSASLRLKHWLLKKLQNPEKTPLPEVVAGAGAAAAQLGGVAAGLGITKPLLVSDAMLLDIGLVGRCVAGLEAAGLECVVYAEVVPNPPASQVEEGYALYRDGGCDGLIAIGGGSPMDCCKIIGAMAIDEGARPVESFVGAFRISGTKKAESKARRQRYPPLIAVPTTAGTGSETTLAAVISFPEKHLKLTIADAAIIPKVAILDPEVIVSLPPSVTAATGMDALTHAVESYLSYWQSPYTASFSLRAVRRIGRWLSTSYHEPSNLEAREEMLRASFEAGVAFTRANVGYVHAVAHTLGAHFGTPHGVGNAMVLPHVLDFYCQDDSCTQRLCELAMAIGLAAEHPGAFESLAGKRKLARAFVAKVRALNSEMGIPASVPDMRPSDVAPVAARAIVEANGEGKLSLYDFGYPSPKYMESMDMLQVVQALLPRPSAKL